MGSRTRRAALFGILAGLLMLPASVAEASYPSQRNGMIAYGLFVYSENVAYGDGASWSDGIYGRDGSLTFDECFGNRYDAPCSSGPPNFDHPSFSPDGTRITFSSVDADRRHVIAIENADAIGARSLPAQTAGTLLRRSCRLGARSSSLAARRPVARKICTRSRRTAQDFAA